MNRVPKYYAWLLCPIFVCLVGGIGHSQTRAIKAKKSGNLVHTATDGSFVINCSPKDKLVFSGKGFERTSEQIIGNNSISVKMIFKGGPANRTAALCNSHVKKDEIDFALEHYSVYNCYPSSYRMYNPFTQRNSKDGEQYKPLYSNLQSSQTDYKSSSFMLTTTSTKQ